MRRGGRVAVGLELDQPHRVFADDQPVDPPGIGPPADAADHRHLGHRSGGEDGGGGGIGEQRLDLVGDRALLAGVERERRAGETGLDRGAQIAGRRRRDAAQDVMDEPPAPEGVAAAGRARGRRVLGPAGTG